MFVNLNPQNSNSSINFSGNYSCSIKNLSSDARGLVESGLKVINDAEKYLQNMQNIKLGKYILSNVEKPSRISPILYANVNGKEITMTKYQDGFNLYLKDGDKGDNLSFWGGDIVEFESSMYPLKASEYKELSGNILQRAETLLKTYLPLFKQ